MPALNFQKQFVQPIRDHTKQHTIRGLRKDGRIPQVGEKYALYCGMRTKNCFRILPELVTITKVEPLNIYYPDGPIVFIDGRELAADEHESLARADGFPDWATMKAFWNGRIPFYGHIIHWRD